MTNPDDAAANLLHLRGATLDKGDPIAPPMTLASMFHLPGDPQAAATYGRVDNPTWELLEHALSHLEDAPVIAFPSGMGAISAAFFSVLKAGDRILLPADGYYATRLLADRFLGAMNIRIDLRPTTTFSEGGFEGYRLVFVETPSNPGLDLCDIRAIASSVRSAGGLTIVDNTTMTPFGQRPLDLGADMVVAADTKAPGGHSDLLLGHVATRDPALMEALREWRKLSGGIPGPFEAWLLHRSLETLELRFDRMCRSAEILASRLASHSAVEKLRYPGLKSDPSFALAQNQMQRPGFLIGLTLASEQAAERFIDGCKFLRPATSFGGVHSSAERRARWGDMVSAGFVRLSVGCEPVESLWGDLKASLDRVAG